MLTEELLGDGCQNKEKPVKTLWSSIIKYLFGSHKLPEKEIENIRIETFDRVEIKETKENINTLDYENLRDWRPSSVAINNNLLCVPNYRFNFVYNKKFTLTIHGFSDFMKTYGLHISDTVDGWDLIKYDVGGKIISHYDHGGEYIFLIFPTIQICTGGQLIVGDFLVNPAMIEKTTLVIFKVSEKHSVSEVLAGQRYVFKRSFSFYSEL